MSDQDCAQDSGTPTAFTAGQPVLVDLRGLLGSASSGWSRRPRGRVFLVDPDADTVTVTLDAMVFRGSDRVTVRRSDVEALEDL